jgi:hypothetical protein
MFAIGKLAANAKPATVRIFVTVATPWFRSELALFGGLGIASWSG